MKKISTKPVKKKNTITIIMGIVVILLIGFGIFKFTLDRGLNQTASVADGEDLVIPKNGVTETARFYPYKAGKTNMEVIAVKASDGSIRTALNTCQVCNGSPKAYYVQDGNYLVCQNCGNRFSMDMVEEERGGCNPVPIMKENKNENDTNITIPKDFLAKSASLFKKWKTA